MDSPQPIQNPAIFRDLLDRALATWEKELSLAEQKRLSEHHGFSLATFNKIYPELLCDYPACTVVKFATQQLNYPVQLPRDHSLKLTLADEDKTPCYFQLKTPCVLNPVTLSRCYWTPSDSGQLTLSLEFSCHGEASTGVLSGEPWAFYLDGPWASAAWLRYFLLYCVESSHITLGGGGNEPIPSASDTVSINENFLLSEKSLIHPGGTEVNSWLTWLDHFCFPQKNRFLLCHGLDGFFKVHDVKHFTLSFSGNQRSLNCATLTKPMVRLHCAPAVNVFAGSGEPIHLKSKQLDYPLLVQSHCKKSTRILRMASLLGGIGRGASSPHEKIDCSSMGSVEYRVSDHSQRGAPQLRVNQGILDRYQFLSPQLQLHNGNLPNHYWHGQPMVTQIPGLQLSAMPLFAPTASVESKCARFPQWSLLQVTLFKHQVGFQRDSLHRQAQVCHWLTANHNQKILSNIVHFSHNEGVQVKDGLHQKSLRFDLVLKEEGFENVGDCFYFAQLIFRVLKQLVPQKKLMVFHGVCLPSQTKWCWASKVTDDENESMNVVRG